MDCDLAIRQAAMIELLQKRLAYLEKQFNTSVKAQSKLLDESLERIDSLEQQQQHSQPSTTSITTATAAITTHSTREGSSIAAASPQKRRLLPSDSDSDEDDDEAVNKKKRVDDVCMRCMVVLCI